MWHPPMATRTQTLGVSTIAINRWLPVGSVSSWDGESCHLVPQQNHSAAPPPNGGGSLRYRGGRWHRTAGRRFHFNSDACLTVSHPCHHVFTGRLKRREPEGWEGHSLLELLEAESGFSCGWRTSSEAEDPGREDPGIPSSGESSVGRV